MPRRISTVLIVCDTADGNNTATEDTEDAADNNNTNTDDTANITNTITAAASGTNDSEQLIVMNKR